MRPGQAPALVRLKACLVREVRVLSR